jgi:hypothetical protein
MLPAATLTSLLIVSSSYCSDDVLLPDLALITDLCGMYVMLYVLQGPSAHGRSAAADRQASQTARSKEADHEQRVPPELSSTSTTSAGPPRQELGGRRQFCKGKRWRRVHRQRQTQQVPQQPRPPPARGCCGETLARWHDDG